MKNIIVYGSKTGFTKKYANWIAEEISAETINVKYITLNKLLEYDNIIYCGGLYAGGILGFSIIKKNFNKLAGKNIIVVAVGATVKKDEAILEIKSKNLTKEIRNKVDFFLLRGGLDYKKMNIVDRILMFLLVTSIKLRKQDETNIEARGMVQTYGKTVDFTNKKYIKPVIDCINSKKK